MKSLFAAVLISSCSLQAIAQAPEQADGRPAGTQSPWSLGAGAIVSDSPFAGEGARIIPVPLVGYEGEQFFVRGVSVGYHLFQDDAVSIDVLGRYRFAAFEVDELGRAELAANGIDDRLLEDRDGGVDLGFALQWTGDAGVLDVELLADATDTSGGQEARVRYSHPFPVGYGSVSPSVGVTWMSEDLANYAYGTVAREVARGVVDFRPGATTIPELGLTLAHPLSQRWFLLGSVRYAFLPDEIRQSPLIDPDANGEASMMLFFTRGF